MSLEVAATSDRFYICTNTIQPSEQVSFTAGLCEMHAQRLRSCILGLQAGCDAMITCTASCVVSDAFCKLHGQSCCHCLAHAVSAVCPL